MHPSLSWDDAKIVLAVVRYGTQAVASRQLGLDEATVSHRLLSLEDALGTPLFVRDEERLTPTDAGCRLAEHAEEAEASLMLAFTVGEDDSAEAEGVVRIAAPPMLAAYVLAPALPLLRQLAPKVIAELVGVPEHRGIAHRDADIGLRFAKPANDAFLSRRIGTITYGVYARRGADAALPWIGFDEQLAETAEGRWLAMHAGEPVIARASEVETVWQAVRAGIGRGVLPTALARRDAQLVALPVAQPLPTRELWLLVERQMRQVRRVSLALGWVEAVTRDALGAPGT